MKKQTRLSDVEIEWGIVIGQKSLGIPSLNDEASIKRVAEFISTEFKVECSPEEVNNVLASIRGEDYELEERRIKYGYDFDRFEIFEKAEFNDK